MPFVSVQFVVVRHDTLTARFILQIYITFNLSDDVLLVTITIQSPLSLNDGGLVRAFELIWAPLWDSCGALNNVHEKISSACLVYSLGFDLNFKLKQIYLYIGEE